MAEQTNPFADLTKMLEQFKVPGVDMSSIVESRRKDIEAIVEANKTAYESMQALARKQTEMLTQAMQDIQQAARDASTGVAFTDPAKASAAARKAIEKAIADMKELAELLAKSNTEAAEIVSKRVSASFDELKGALKAPTKR